MHQNNDAITAIIITKDEGQRIAGCIRSLGFCTRIIVVDNGSTDQTARIARKLGATVVGAKTNDFSRLRSLAVGRVTGGWLLYIDADEIVSGELARQMVEAAKQTEKNGFLLTRKNTYLGRDWPYREKILRFFRKSAFVRWQGEIHETAIVTGAVGVLDGFLYHDTHRLLAEMVEKTNRWSEVEAQLRYDAHHPAVTWWRLLRVMATGFLDSFIHKRGYRAGMVGIVESVYQAFSLFITYAKLWEKQESN